MWRIMKFIVITVLAVLPIITLMLVGEGCIQAGDSDGNQTETENGINKNPDRMQQQMHLDEVAEILGIEQQELENALTQARDELGDGGLRVLPEEWTPDDPPPDGSPPEGLPGSMGPPTGRPLPEALLARMAEILNIDQQTLEDAFAHAHNTDNSS
jgi:hypothetical protein